MRALILVDLQNDFCALGALEVPEGDLVVPIANALMEHFDLVVATKDWHPGDHGSFAANHPWRKPGQVIDLNGLPQVLWPMHCVQNSFGAEFHPALDTSQIDEVVYKGTNPKVDSYSGFFDNGRLQATELQDILKQKGVEEVFIMGLATDYCVKYTVLDARSLGYPTWLIVDACRGVELQPGDVEKSLEEMTAGGAKLIQSSEVMGVSI